MEFSRVVILGDTHFPWASSRGVKAAIEFVKRSCPSIVIQIGDLYDVTTFKKYTTKLNEITPQQELNRGRKAAEAMWDSIRSAVPKARCIQMTGNHDGRILKRVHELLSGLDAKVKIRGKYEPLLNISSLFKFDGVDSVLDETAELRIGDVLFTHGWAGNVGDHLRYYRSNVVCGHLHRGGVYVERINNKTLWELNAGYLGDIHAPVFQYGDHKTKKWTPGFGVIDEFGPRFISL